MRVVENTLARARRQAGLEVLAIRRTPADVKCETPQNDLLVARKASGGAP